MEKRRFWMDGLPGDDVHSRTEVDTCSTKVIGSISHTCTTFCEQYTPVARHSPNTTERSRAQVDRYAADLLDLSHSLAICASFPFCTVHRFEHWDREELLATTVARLPLVKQRSECDF